MGINVASKNQELRKGKYFHETKICVNKIFDDYFNKELIANISEEELNLLFDGFMYNLQGNVEQICLGRKLKIKIDNLNK